MEYLANLKNRLLKNGCRVGNGSSEYEILKFEDQNNVSVDKNLHDIFSAIGPVELYSDWIIINLWSINNWKISHKSGVDLSLFMIGDIMLDSDFIVSAIDSDKNPILLHSDHSIFSLDIYSLFDSLTKPFD